VLVREQRSIHRKNSKQSSFNRPNRYVKNMTKKSSKIGKKITKKGPTNFCRKAQGVSMEQTREPRSENILGQRRIKIGNKLKECHQKVNH
jgi:hypothetical protein